MLSRRIGGRLIQLLRHSPAVVLLGPRQVGKTTLALQIGEQQASVYLDLEDEDERAKLSNPVLYLADHERELVILDEVHCFSGCEASSTGDGGMGRQMGGSCFSDQPPWTC